jgi:hypothetical protein
MSIEAIGMIWHLWQQSDGPMDNILTSFKMLLRAANFTFASFGKLIYFLAMGPE